MPWDSSLYQRRILHYFSDTVTLKQVLSEKGGNSRVTDAWFEKLRMGGDGAGSITLRDSFADRNDVQIGDWIAFEFTAGTRWYFGRVENVDHSSPKGAQISLQGMWAELGEVFPGAFANAGSGKPHRFANSDYFPNDPDHTFQTVDTVGQPESVVKLLFDRYVASQTHVVIGSIESPPILSGFQSMVVRGEESVAELYRRLSSIARMMSVGVNEFGQLYFINRRFTTIASYQEGVNARNITQQQDRSLLFNRMLLTGGYIYGGAVNPYRSRWNFKHIPSIALHGERVIEIFAPEIRRNHDAVNFQGFFFSQFAQATVRYTFRAEYDGIFPLPHLGWIRLLDRNANLIANGQFDRIRVQFDHKPIFDITIGPEDLQFPNAPENQRWEIPDPDDLGDGEDPPSESQHSQDSTIDESSIRSSGALSSAESSRLKSSADSSAGSSAGSSDAIVSSADSSARSSAGSSDALASSALSSQQKSSAESSAAVSSAGSSAAVSSALSSDLIASSALSSDQIQSSADSSARKSSGDSSDLVQSSADSSDRLQSSADSSAASSDASQSRLESSRASSAAISSAASSSAASSSAASSDKEASEPPDP